MLMHRGAFAEAEPLRRRVLDARERRWGPEHRLGKLSEAPLSRAAEWAWRLGWAAFYGGNSLTKTTEIHNSSFFAEVPKLEVPKKFQKDMSKFQKNQTTCLQRTDTYPW